MARMSWVRAVLIAVDQLLNAVFAGWPDETLSSRAYRCGVLDQTPKLRWVVARWVIDAIFFWQKEHCMLAYQSELTRRHSPPTPAV